VEAFNGRELSYINLFPFAALVMTCFGLASFAILFEGIKVYQAHIKHSIALEDEHCHSERCANERSSLLGNDRSSHIPNSHRYASL
jgi:hypothetical protein